jgi:hypothetical protein
MLWPIDVKMEIDIHITLYHHCSYFSLQNENSLRLDINFDERYIKYLQRSQMEEDALEDEERTEEKASNSLASSVAEPEVQTDAL